MHYNAFKVFGKVAARLDPQPLGLSFSSLEEILQSIKDEARVERRRIFDGFVVSGTFESAAHYRKLYRSVVIRERESLCRQTAESQCIRRLSESLPELINLFLNQPMVKNIQKLDREGKLERISRTRIESAHKHGKQQGDKQGRGQISTSGDINLWFCRSFIRLPWC